MICYICVDKNFGLSFNNRRVSRDKNVLLDMVKCSKKIKMSKYSEELFKSLNLDSFIGEDLSCDIFFEVSVDYNVLNKCDTLIIYNWNRSYPSDVVFKINIDDYIITEQKDFEGTSHDCITKITYKKCV